jgi:antitoxin component of MazEF toxin-antitoxin module
MESVMEWETFIRKSGGTFYARIPSDWVRNKRIQKGDEIKVSLNVDGSLRIDKK